MTCLCGSNRLLGQISVQKIGYAATLHSSTLPSLCAALKKMARTEQVFGLSVSGHTATYLDINAVLRCTKRRKPCVGTQGSRKVQFSNGRRQTVCHYSEAASDGLTHTLSTLISSSYFIEESKRQHQPQAHWIRRIDDCLILPFCFHFPQD